MGMLFVCCFTSHWETFTCTYRCHQLYFDLCMAIKQQKILIVLMHTVTPYLRSHPKDQKLVSNASAWWGNSHNLWWTSCIWRGHWGLNPRPPSCINRALRWECACLHHQHNNTITSMKNQGFYSTVGEIK